MCLLLPAWASGQQLVIGTGPATEGVVRVLDPVLGDRSFQPYVGFAGGIRVAQGDVNGDGVLDIITGAGPGGGPHVQVFDGATLGLLASFMAYDPSFPGGVFVAAGDVNGDGKADIVTGAGAGGGPHVQVFDGATLSVLASFMAYAPFFAGGVSVAAGDVNGDGKADIVTGAGPSGGPHVVVYSGADTAVLSSFYAYVPAFPGGVNVAAGDINGDGRADIITGAGPGGGPHVRVFNGVDLAELASYMAYDPAFIGGVTVTAGDYNGDGVVDVITGPGSVGGPHVRVFSGDDTRELASFMAFTSGGGAFVGAHAESGLRITSAATATFTAGAAGTFTITTVGRLAPTLAVGGMLPAGVTFVDNGDGTGTLNGTPSAGTGGAYPLTITATDGVKSASQSFTLTVNEAAAITSASAAAFTTGAPGSFTVTTTGFPQPTIARGGAALPAGVTFVDGGNGTATLSGTPALGTGGTYAMTFTAANGVGAPVVQTFTLVVSGAPTFTSAAAATFTVGSAGTFTVTTIATPPAVLSVAGTLPAGVTFADNGNGTGTLSGTPAAATGAIYPLTFTATNSVGGATQAFSLTVNEAPAITSASAATFAMSAMGTFNVVTTGFPPPGLVQGGALPGGVTFVDNGDGTGTLSGTPAAGTGGTYALTLTATNGLGSVVQAFTLTVNASPGFTSAASTTFTVGSAGSFAVTAIGTPTPAITVSGALPSGVTFVDNGDGTGTLSGTPAAGTGGAFALTFTAVNGVLPEATQAFTLTINQGPAMTSAASTTFTVGSAGTFTVTTSGFPAPAIAIGGAPLPAGVTFADNGNGTGTLSGTPSDGTGGTYALSFTATNAFGTSAPQAFTLTVNQAPAITSANTVSFTMGAAGTFTVTATGFPVPTITRSGAALPAGVTFVDNGNGTGTLSGTPAAGTAGAYAFTFTATNGTPPSASQTFTLNVNAPPAITSANTATFTVGAPGSFTVTTTGFPAPTVSEAGALPTGVTFTPATRVLGGTPTQAGTFNAIQFTASNGILPNAVQNFTLNVVCPTITVNPAVLAQGLYQTAYTPVTFTQTGSTGSTITWSATGLPAGLAIAPGTGVVSGTPTTTVLNASLTIRATDNFGCTGARSVTLTIRPATDNESYTGGVGNTQFVVGAAAPTTPRVVISDNVKTGDSGPGTLSVTFPATSPNGTVTEGGTDGTFIYTPNVGFAGPTDTFTYTLTDGNGITNTATVTIALSNLVWYVNRTAGAGDGRSHNPFNSLATAGTASAANSFIYVHTGGTPATPGNLTMDANQTLHGEGAVFTLNSLTIPAGTRPNLGGTVTLANNTIVRGVNFRGPAGMNGSAITQPVAIDQVNVTGGINALSLTNVSGAVTVTAAVFTNSTGAEVLINQGTGDVSLAATISSNAGRSIDIQNRTGGTVSFTGSINDTGQGVFLNANTGSTINFTGGLTLSTGANPAFTATGGGTVSATQDNTTIVNTLTTTTGTALNVADTTIGVGGLAFRRITANGGANGVVLSNTGTAGGLTVTGTGGVCTTASPTCTGGRIRNTTGADSSSVTPTGAGIVLNNTRSVSLSSMRVDNHSNYAIRGTSVDGFRFDNGLVDGTNGTNAAAPFNDGSLIFQGVAGTSSGMTGTGAITNSTIQGGRQRNINIDNSVGTLNLTVNNNIIRRSSDTAGDDGFRLEADTTASVTVTITNNTFARHGGDHLDLSLVDNAIVAATITGNTLQGNYTGAPEGNHPIGLGQGIFIQGVGFNGSFTYNISSNGTAAAPFRGNRQRGAIHVSKVSGTGTFSGRIEHNVIGDPLVTGSGSSEASGIVVGARGASGSHTTLINNNQVRQYFSRGIVLEAGEGGAALNATVTSNTVSNFSSPASSLHGIHANNGLLAADTNAVCLAMSGNSVGTAGNEPQGGADIRLQRSATTTVRLPGLAGTTNADATTLLRANNPTATTVTVTGDVFSGGAACPLP
jgi:hypothetical protein